MITFKFRFLLHLKKITCLPAEGIYTGIKICQDLLLCHFQWKAVKVKTLHVILASHATSNFNLLLNCHSVLWVLYSNKWMFIIHVSFETKKKNTEIQQNKEILHFSDCGICNWFWQKEKWKWDISNRNRLWIAHGLGGNFARSGRLVVSTSSSVRAAGLLFPFPNQLVFLSPVRSASRNPQTSKTSFVHVLEETK